MANIELHGLLLINKPANLTSFDVVRQLRALLGWGVKVGHAGTLDPFATGLLIICFGKATKLVSLLMDVEKSYRVQAKIGELTDSLDKTGKLLGEGTVPENLASQLLLAIERLGRFYEQKPPVFSALKHQGLPLHLLARHELMARNALEELTQSKARWVMIFEMTIEKVESNFATLFCRVSKGAYIRSLADDLVQTIGLRATTYELDRTSIGPFKLDMAYDLDIFSSSTDIKQRVIPLEEARAFILNNGAKKAKTKTPGR